MIFGKFDERGTSAQPRPVEARQGLPTEIRRPTPVTAAVPEGPKTE
jgi:hypothetical protein